MATAVIAVGGLLGWFSASGRLNREALAQDKASPTVPKLDRTVLPPPAPEFKGRIGQNYKDSQPDWNPALPLQAPADAPNVIVIVLDDVGFGHLGCYGGPIQTPNLDKLAAGGLRYNNFHTTALCSPSRGALLTGRNHHAIGLAAITEAATGYPGNVGDIPKSAATIAEMLKQRPRSTRRETGRSYRLCSGRWGHVNSSVEDHYIR